MQRGRANFDVQTRIKQQDPATVMRDDFLNNLIPTIFDKSVTSPKGVSPINFLKYREDNSVFH